MSNLTIGVRYIKVLLKSFSAWGDFLKSAIHLQSKLTTFRPFQLLHRIQNLAWTDWRCVSWSPVARTKEVTLKVVAVLFLDIVQFYLSLLFFSELHMCLALLIKNNLIWYVFLYIILEILLLKWRFHHYARYGRCQNASRSAVSCGRGYMSRPARRHFMSSLNVHSCMCCKKNEAFFGRALRGLVILTQAKMPCLHQNSAYPLALLENS